MSQPQSPTPVASAASPLASCFSPCQPPAPPSFKNENQIALPPSLKTLRQLSVPQGVKSQIPLAHRSPTCPGPHPVHTRHRDLPSAPHTHRAQPTAGPQDRLRSPCGIFFHVPFRWLSTAYPSISAVTCPVTSHHLIPCPFCTNGFLVLLCICLVSACPTGTPGDPGLSYPRCPQYLADPGPRALETRYDQPSCGAAKSGENPT